MRRGHILLPLFPSLPEDLSLNVVFKEKTFEPLSKLGPNASLRLVLKLIIVCLLESFQLPAHYHTKSLRAKTTAFVLTVVSHSLAQCLPHYRGSKNNEKMVTKIYLENKFIVGLQTQ